MRRGHNRLGRSQLGAHTPVMGTQGSVRTAHGLGSHAESLGGGVGGFLGFGS